MQKYYFALLLLLLIAACRTTSKLADKDLSQLNGRWELACSGPIAQPEALECPDFIGYQDIVFDAEGRKGKFHFQLPEQTLDQPFQLLEENGKWYLYYVDDQGNTSKGEIVRLDGEQLILHYAREGIMTMQKRAK